MLVLLVAKDPAFLFYPGDFNTGTQFMSDEQVGKYMRLLMAQHQHGHLTENQVIFICKSYDKDVMSKFIKDSDGLWYNERLESEVIKRKRFVESRSKNKEGKTKKKIISSSYDSHMENENINGISINKGEITKFNHEEFYQDGQTAFDDIKQDELLIERLVRIVQQAGFRGCDAVKITLAVRKFVTVESAKEEFSIKPKAEVKRHLVNWINKNAKNIEEYAGVSR